MDVPLLRRLRMCGGAEAVAIPNAFTKYILLFYKCKVVMIAVKVKVK